jgi:hypothetical protein
MKHIQNISAKLERQLIRAFAMLDAWFDAEDTGGYVRDLLESIVRQNQRLLSQMSEKAHIEPANVHRYSDLLSQHQADCAVGDASDVYNVGHKEESKEAMADLRRELRSQLEFCLDQLDALRESERLSYQRIAAVESLLNLDIYQYVRCIMQITRRGYEDISEADERKK